MMWRLWHSEQGGAWKVQWKGEGNDLTIWHFFFFLPGQGELKLWLSQINSIFDDNMLHNRAIRSTVLLIICCITGSKFVESGELLERWLAPPVASGETGQLLLLDLASLLCWCALCCVLPHSAVYCRTLLDFSTADKHSTTHLFNWCTQSRRRTLLCDCLRLQLRIMQCTCPVYTCSVVPSLGWTSLNL